MGNSPKQWDKTGIVVEKGDHDQYVIKVAGSGRLTTRNRTFLRCFRPIMKTGKDQDFQDATLPPTNHDPPLIPLLTVPLSLPAPCRPEHVDVPPSPCRPEHGEPPPAPRRPEHDEPPPALSRQERDAPPDVADPIPSHPPPTPRRIERSTPPNVADPPPATHRSQRNARAPREYVPETGQWT
ncbi:PREDICTED: classical arabinogalactan protein 9-like [Priapulus caudatus]|uniref:Classical arabinogalactan protein 9-like n=1 Tax=Priapulus caudatus TaxID=37621 RepID=A0ABM1EFC3_PRICU|nr:PREDICTED: classical arabinogalactan protein 9-like [Priapulus caudatus]